MHSAQHDTLKKRGDERLEGGEQCNGRECSHAQGVITHLETLEIAEHEECSAIVAVGEPMFIPVGAQALLSRNTRSSGQRREGG